MPAGRPPKRSGHGMDSSLGSSSSASKAKLPRLERGPEDFSLVVKNKLQSYTRTGQACDRCKVRKIRCDQLPDGCTHCTQQNLECYVTDRVTGRTERRGYLQQLEREKSGLLGHIRDLEKLLEGKGVQTRPWQSTTTYDHGTSFESDSYGASSKDPWTQFGSLWIRDFNSEQSRPMSAGPSGQPSPPGPAIGLRTVSAHLGSSINGTQLSVLGTTIDITSFDVPDMDGPPLGTPKATPIYNKSLQSFYNSVAKVNPPIDAPFPSRDEAFSYSEWFFVMVGAFVPLLHKPTYLKLLARIYDDRDFKPTTAELVMVHMVFAIMYYQFGVRNGENTERKAQLNELSNKHYHWSVDKLWDLAPERSIPSIQALVLMAIHCRGFPKPGPAWSIVTLTWNRAIEMDLHRAYLKKDEPTNLENEVRKRTWWSLFMIVVMLYGRLGKPMPIRTEDIDVDWPVAIPDEYITEDGITDPEKIGDCYWLVAVSGIKLSCLFMDMWNNVYSVRQKPDRYVEAVRRIEQNFRIYQRELPDELKPNTCKPENRVIATYLEASNLEFLFCLRHPSRCVTTDPAFLAENYRVCEEASKKMLRVTNELAKLKSLDTTWYQMAVYVAAIFMLLASRWERRAEITPAELSELKEQMTLGLSVIQEILKYIGTTDFRVMHQISVVVDRTVASIEQDMNSRRSSRTSTPQYGSQPQHISNRSSKHDDYTSSSRQGRPSRSACGTPTSMVSRADQVPMPRMGGVPSHSNYNSPLASINSAYSQMGYPELGSSAVPTPTTSANTSYIPVTDESSHHQYLYATTAAATAAQMVHNTPGSSPQSAPASHNPMVGYSNQAPPSATAHHHQQAHTSGGGHWMGVPNPGSSWNEWTNTMVDPSTQDRYSANALLTLGGGQRGHGEAGGGEIGVGASGVPPGQSEQQWPMLIFHPPNVSGA